jgi:hypothetical protein
MVLADQLAERHGCLLEHRHADARDDADGAWLVLHDAPRERWAALRAAGFVAVGAGSEACRACGCGAVAGAHFRWFRGFCSTLPCVGADATIAWGSDLYAAQVTACAPGLARIEVAHRLDPLGATVRVTAGPRAGEASPVAVLGMRERATLRRDGTYKLVDTRRGGLVTIGAATTRLTPGL